MEPSLYRRLRALASPLHPGRLWRKLVHLAHRMGYFHVRLWVIAFDPRRIAATWRWARGMRQTMRRRREQPLLTVAVDISAFWEPLTGIGWYLYRLLEHLADRDDLRLRLYGPRLVDKPGMPEPVIEPPAGRAVELVSYRVPENLSIVHYYLADRLRAREARLIAADGNDLLFAPNYFLPQRFDRCGGRLVATIHDLGFRRVPETLRESTRQDLARHLEATARRAARVLTDSETVRGELVETGLVEASRVHAVHLGPAMPTSDAGEPDAALPAQTPDAYVLHVGTLEPRKNLPTLLAAWRQLRADGRQPPPLVLCGGFGWKTDELRREMAAAAAEGWLLHFGYLAEESVAALYRRALLVVVPSIYEGFGLPAVEAMSVGVPLLCSDIPVLREVAGDAACYAPPSDPRCWAETAAELLADSERRAALGRKGRERSRRFDWRRTAEQTLEVWRSAAQEGSS